MYVTPEMIRLAQDRGTWDARHGSSSRNLHARDARDMLTARYGAANADVLMSHWAWTYDASEETRGRIEASVATVRSASRPGEVLGLDNLRG